MKTETKTLKEYMQEQEEERQLMIEGDNIEDYSFEDEYIDYISTLDDYYREAFKYRSFDF